MKHFRSKTAEDLDEKSSFLGARIEVSYLYGKPRKVLDFDLKIGLNGLDIHKFSSSGSGSRVSYWLTPG